MAPQSTARANLPAAIESNPSLAVTSIGAHLRIAYESDSCRLLPPLCQYRLDITT